MDFKNTVSFITVDPDQWDTLTVEQKTHYLNEASEYLKGTLGDWKEKSICKVVSLAKLAYKWNSQLNPQARIKLLKSEMDTVNKMIEKRKKMGLPTEAFDRELAAAMEELTALRQKYPELI